MPTLLATTSFSLLAIDIDSLASSPVHRGKGLYYGIAATSDGSIFVAARNRRVSSDVPADQERGEIIVIDREHTVMGSLASEHALRDMHEISWHDGRLWITCSRDNCLVVHDGDTWERWYPLPEDAEAERDLHHYNSLLFEADSLWLLAHNHGDSELLHFDIRERRLLGRRPFGRIAHNIWREDGTLFTCSSADGTVIDEHGNARVVGSFPRGYVRLPDGRRVVGLNAHAERAKRDAVVSHIGIFDDDWKPIATLPLEDEGMVLDLRLAAP